MAETAPTCADIIIVNWNSGGQLQDCLSSIAAHGAGRVGKVIVVDNGSTDGSDRVEAPALQLVMVRAGRNLGFGPACNFGATHADAPFLLFLNPDAELREGVLAGALDHFAVPGADRVGVVGVRLVGRDGAAHRHCARFPSWRSFVGNSLGLTRALKRWFPPIPLLEFDHLSSRSVDHVMGAFYCIRRDVFEAVGGFDEGYFVYLEDLDLSRRVVQAGWRIDYVADVAAYHKQGGTSEQVKAHRLLYALEGNLIYAAKHLPWWQAATVGAVTLTVEPVSRLARAALVRRSADEFRFTAQGFGMLYRALPDIWRRMRGGKAGAGA